MGDIELLELYMKQGTVSTTFNSECQLTNLGTEFALSVARWANMDYTTEKRIYTTQMCRLENLARLLRLWLDGANLSWNGTERLVFVWLFSDHKMVQGTVVESEKSCSHVGAGFKCRGCP